MFLVSVGLNHGYPSPSYFIIHSKDKKYLLIGKLRRDAPFLHISGSDDLSWYEIYVIKPINNPKYFFSDQISFNACDIECTLGKVGSKLGGAFSKFSSR